MRSSEEILEGFFEGKYWIREIRTGVFYFGVTQKLNNEVSEMLSVELASVAETFTKGDWMGELEGTHGSFTLFAPFDGEILEVNADISKNIEALIDDPFGEAWLYVLTKNESQS